MDALARLLDGPRARGAFFLRSIFTPPWSLRVRDGAPLTLVAMVRGEAWLVPETGDPVLLRPGDTAVVRGPEPYTMADDPDTPPKIVIHPGQRCATPDGRPLDGVMDLGVRTWGDSPDGPVMMLTCTYQMRGEISGRLLAALPVLVVLAGDAWDSPLIPLLAGEMVKDEPGQEAVLDRLLDLLLIAVLRAWFARADGGAPAWYRAYGDPVVGTALRLVHNAPEHPWTVAELASRSGVSRAALARRFAELVGEPPMAYLTGWRLDLAADLLRETDATIEAVARQVGYGSAFALSAAFKRVRGVSPRDHRAAAPRGV
ncbi:AraC family transcriptional regulator [Sphaerisporangium siamense]|uniref:AraC-like DNA-binding protein n=1 Tax=Sphaerisporangium siamense TaxID=795645 RepID=A0A7W7GCQ9_9ACTN|nr:AraC family transcriptional regulator [Sphaerisporangium siamense]MBB4704140.1 AraC-like DNA-binding protein [Sphaerisporangium siamense]GII82619.1 AraC family transcriptional regulator [Sphaerisporangium siamense]